MKYDLTQRYLAFKRALEIAIVLEKVAEISWSFSTEILEQLDEAVLQQSLEKRWLKDKVEVFLLRWQNDISPEAEIFWYTAEREKWPYHRKKNALLNIILKGHTSNIHETILFFQGVYLLRHSKIYFMKYTTVQIQQIDAVLEKMITIHRKKLEKAFKRGRFLDFTESYKYNETLILTEKSNLFRERFTEEELLEFRRFYEQNDDFVTPTGHPCNV